jgi:hypothetical protein
MYLYSLHEWMETSHMNKIKKINQLIKQHNKMKECDFRKIWEKEAPNLEFI